MPAPSRLAPSAMVRRSLISGVRAVLNDDKRGQAPVQRSDAALFASGSVIWRVHGDVTTMMIGGVTALLLQMLHPAALAGVWDHSSFRSDMLGRLRRTARFIAVTTYAERDEAQAAIDTVRRVHEHVGGALPDGRAYCASDPDLLAWVHVCEAYSFLEAWIRYREPAMSRADQDTYFAQAGRVATSLGAAPVPETRDAAMALIRAFRPQLVANARTFDVAAMVLEQPAPYPAAAPVQRLVMDAAVDLMPRWAKAMHKRRVSALRLPMVRGGALAMAQTLNWAFTPPQASAAPR